VRNPGSKAGGEDAAREPRSQAAMCTSWTRGWIGALANAYPCASELLQRRYCIIHFCRARGSYLWATL
jgi:hypothetical protein